MVTRNLTLTTAILTALNLPILASAQSAATQLDEIMVTAQKRTQSFGDVGIAVSVLSGEDVRSLGFTQLKDVAAQTPNVQIKEVVANSVPNVTIRGVGLNDYAANNNPAAGIYVDDVYLVSPTMLSFGLFDLDRIEVLKGPQGTLFGRNTTAGTVNFYSRKPTAELEGYVSLDYGRYDRAMLEAAIGGPLGDRVQGRLAVQSVQQGSGWQINRLNGDRVGEVDRTAGRVQLAWTVGDAVTVRLGVHAGNDQSDVALIKIDNPFTPEDDGETNPFRSGASVPTRMDLEARGAYLGIDWAISETLTLNSVTGYEDFSRMHVEDRDAASLEQLDGYFANDIEQFSEELRLTRLGDRLVLIGGVFYGTDSVETRDRFDSRDLLPLFGLAGMASIGNEYDQDTTSKAVFVHSEWKLTPDWKLTAGARYTDEQKEFRNAFTYLITTGGTEIQIFPPVARDFDSQDVSGRIGLDYSGWADTLLYASVSRGFKSGGFQGQLTFDPSGLQPFDDETLIAWEVGLKTRRLGNTLQFNASAFYYDYQDLQFYGGLFDSPVGTLFGIANVGDAEVKGAEVDLWWRPAAGLDLRLGVGLLDTEVTRSVVPGVTRGSELPNSPEMTLNGLIRYQWPLTGNLTAEMQLAANYQGDVTFDTVRNPPVASESGYWLADARIGIGAQDGRWNLAAWCRNLADERYRTQVTFSSVGYGESVGPPRTYGVNLTFRL
ncbi:MAG: TonB-dependent receptor [Gammaproteobacteria bacterium]|nr:TonB-dependent receptor [Gammaproteobacteria bacterium]